MVQGQPIDTHIHLSHEPELNKFFKAAIKSQASDVHLKVGQVPKLRIRGSLKSTTGEIMSEEKMEQLIFEIMSPAQKDYFLKNGALDFAHEVTDVDRFRINVFRQRGMVSLVGRRITSTIPPFESLHLPPVVEKIAQSHDGLVLVTGPTGSGKTTTIASMIDYISTNSACHIVTIEDPIEYLYKDKKAIVSQREIGI
ncbi:MAG: ATPase, T2SS/T4P/T4SS family, partial [Sedimentisphaerales bacterium]|nr:ATPase, T2SS/T4P/T4SS family [Sedimentisphaerales bacterium]